MHDDLDNELPPCVGEKMRDIAQGFRQRPAYLQPIQPVRTRGKTNRCNRIDAWVFYHWVSELQSLPSIKEISAHLNIGLMTARCWRNDWLKFYTPEKRKQK